MHKFINDGWGWKIYKIKKLGGSWRWKRLGLLDGRIGAAFPFGRTKNSSNQPKLTTIEEVKNTETQHHQTLSYTIHTYILDSSQTLFFGFCFCFCCTSQFCPLFYCLLSLHTLLLWLLLRFSSCASSQCFLRCGWCVLLRVCALRSPICFSMLFILNVLFRSPPTHLSRYAFIF